MSDAPTGDPLAYRTQGYSDAEIAETLGLAVERVRELIAKALAELPVETPETARKLELMRIDYLLSIVWPSAAGGDHHAISSVIALMARRSAVVRDAGNALDGIPLVTF